MAVTHAFVSTKPAAADPTQVGSVEWNDAHVVSIVNADVANAAAIVESKLSLNFPTHPAVTLGTPNGLSLATQALSLGLASSGVTGALSGTDWDTFNGKQAALTLPLSPAQGGTGVDNGSNTLTIPATGTAALLATANVFTANQEINGNLIFTAAGGKTISTSGTSLTLTQTGDTYGASTLSLQSRFGSAGALFSSGTLDLIDFGFKPASGPQANIRLEHRSTQCLSGNSTNGEFQYILDSTGAAPFCFRVGSATAYLSGNLGIGLLNPQKKLHTYEDVNDVGGFMVENPNNGAYAQVQNVVKNDAASLGYFGITSSNFAYPGVNLLHGGKAFYGGNGVDAVILTQTANDIIFATNGFGLDKEHMRISSAGLVSVLGTTTTTNAVLETLHIEARVSTASTGGANGFGTGLSLSAETATDGTNQQQALIASSWIDATNASRKAKLSLSAYDTAARLGVEIEADGSEAKLGFYGVAPIARAVLATGASHTVDDVITALQNLGLVKQS